MTDRVGIPTVVILCLMGAVCVLMVLGMYVVAGYGLLNWILGELITDPVGSMLSVVKGVGTLTLGIILWGICIVSLCLLAIFIEKTWMKEVFGSVGGLLLILFIIYLLLRLL